MFINKRVWCRGVQKSHQFALFRVIVWCVIWAGGVTGSYFFEHDDGATRSMTFSAPMRSIEPAVHALSTRCSHVSHYESYNGYVEITISRMFDCRRLAPGIFRFVFFRLFSSGDKIRTVSLFSYSHFEFFSIGIHRIHIIILMFNCDSDIVSIIYEAPN